MLYLFWLSWKYEYFQDCSSRGLWHVLTDKDYKVGGDEGADMENFSFSTLG